MQTKTINIIAKSEKRTANLQSNTANLQTGWHLSQTDRFIEWVQLLYYGTICRLLRFPHPKI